MKKIFDYTENSRIAFPLGGIGAGMVCLEGTGAFSHFSLHHKPNITQAPLMFAAVHLNDVKDGTRLMEGPVPAWKVLGFDPGGTGACLPHGGLPRFASSSFESRFPFGVVRMKDPALPLEVELTGWSPFIPGNADDSGLPLAVLEYTLINKGQNSLKGNVSFNSVNFLHQKQPDWQEPPDKCLTEVVDGGWLFRATGRAARPHVTSSFAVVALKEKTIVNAEWFRGYWFDMLSVLWERLAGGTCEQAEPPADAWQTPGATVYVPFSLAAGASRTVRFLMAWYTPSSRVAAGDPAKKQDCKDPACKCGPGASQAMYTPRYASVFGGVEAVLDFAKTNFARLRNESEVFAGCLQSTTLPSEVLDSVEANLAILKSPTILRDGSGRLWGWEGCGEKAGCCHGSCTHVWNYAQSIPHLFPELERSLRETEFLISTKSTGYQGFRSNLPMLPIERETHPAADGQLGGLMKLYRDYLICGDKEWLRRLWPNAKLSLNYCIDLWDPRRQGYLEEPHHNTYDNEFWGPDGMCTSFYLGALKAAALMGAVLGDDIEEYARLYKVGRKFMETELFNGEYFVQLTRWEGLKAGKPIDYKTLTLGDSPYSPELRAVVEKEGPRYQYGSGCLSDGVIGAWMAEVCGVGEILDPAKVKSHLKAIYKHNFKRPLTTHANPQRCGFALGGESGLVLCTWPRGGQPTIPFPFSHEVWTGIEYQVASHMMMTGMVREGLAIVKAVRKRYDGTARNPFDELECGHWYARAMSSYALLQGLGGARLDAVARTLYLQPAAKGDFACFIAGAGGYGLTGVENGKPFLRLIQGELAVDNIVLSGTVTNVRAHRK